MSEQQTAFAALQELAHKSSRFAQPLPAQIDTGAQWSGVGFSLMGFQFIVPMGQLAEILEIPNLTRLPNVHGWVKGVANIRGRLLPVFDMAEFLGGRLTNHRKVQRVLIVDVENLYLGLWVDYVHGMQYFPAENELTNLPDVLPHSMSHYVSGGFELEKNLWFVFNSTALLEDKAFLDVALD